MPADLPTDTVDKAMRCRTNSLSYRSTDHYLKPEHYVSVYPSTDPDGSALRRPNRSVRRPAGPTPAAVRSLPGVSRKQVKNTAAVCPWIDTDACCSVKWKTKIVMTTVESSAPGLLDSLYCLPPPNSVYHESILSLNCAAASQPCS